jgi:hypothetical protein
MLLLTVHVLLLSQPRQLLPPHRRNTQHVHGQFPQVLRQWMFLLWPAVAVAEAQTVVVTTRVQVAVAA